jgi:polysaccharide export outer membrane protein
MQKESKIRYRTIVLEVAALALMVCQTGCFPSNPKDIEAFVRPGKVEVAAESYILRPPDEILVDCSKVPELHEKSQQIRPDGKVTFEGIGEVMVAGKTPKQLAELLREKVMLLYALQGENPVNVRVTAYKSMAYYVLGEVSFPGPKVCTGRDTLLDAIAISRPTILAWIERIQVIRPSADKNIKPKIFELNYEKLMSHGDTSKNVLLEAGDIVYVPPTVLAWMAMKVEEAVRPIGRAFATVNIVQGPTATYR